MVRYQDWTGERKQKCKRGFATKREAQEWERSFQMQTSGDLDMTFEAFTELYTKDVKPRLKENTWLTKENIIQKKILPYFGKRKISEIDHHQGRDSMAERVAGLPGREAQALFGYLSQNPAQPA